MKYFILISVIAVSFLITDEAEANRLYSSGIEHQRPNTEFSNVATTTTSTLVVHSGAVSAQMSGTLQTGAFQGLGNSTSTTSWGREVYARWYIYLDNLPDDADVAATMDLKAGSLTTSTLSIQISEDPAGTYGTIIYYNNFASTLANSITFATGTWYRVEAFWDSNNALNLDVLDVRVYPADGSAPQAASSSALQLTSSETTHFQFGVFNGTAGTITTQLVYFDDVAINVPTGDSQTSWPGPGNTVLLVPTASGDSACSSGTFDDIDEVPPSDTLTGGGAETCDLDTTTVHGRFNVTNTGAVGIDAIDTISLVYVSGRVKEETSGATNYGLTIQSNTGTHAASTSVVDAGDTDPRFNPLGTTAFVKPLISYYDPTTLMDWTASGTNSIDNMQIGAYSTDGSPDVWVGSLYANVEYVDGTAFDGNVPTTNLAAYWPLDEESGNAIDAHDDNDLTETGGTIATSTGKINNARDFELDDTEYFALADNTDLSTGNIDFTITAWVNLETEATKQPIVSKQTDGTNGSYDLRYEPTLDDFQFRVWGSAAFGNAGSVATTIGATTATWYFVVAWHDSVTNSIHIQVNDGTVVGAAHTAGTFDDAGQFQIGATAIFSEYFDGLIDEVGFWKRVLTADERTALYNAGAGFAYPFTVASSPPAPLRTRRQLIGPAITR